MNRKLARAITPVLVWLSFAGARATAEDNTRQVDLYISHRLFVLATQELEVRISIYNRTGAEQTFAGDAADDMGDLMLSGDWRLSLEEVKRGKVVSTKDLRPEKRPQADVVELEPLSHKDWKAQISLKQWVGHSGNYRFQLSLGEHKSTGRLFRIVRKPGMPEHIYLDYTPDRKSYFIGEPINVHFTMTNDDTDEFHFEEGGDYRGANRHLRYAFTAETEDEKKAVDPKPSQTCFGGLGMADPHLKPEEKYEKDLPLLAYLKFPEPGEYTVRCYQSLGFGFPEKVIKEAGSYKYVLGGSFDIEIRLPSKKEAADLLKSSLDKIDGDERRRNFSFLQHECYLTALVDLIQDESDEEKIEALFEGIASIVTVPSTCSLVSLACHKRESVRIAALRRLSWRLPDPRDTGQVPTDSAFHFYSSEARRRDSKASWDREFRPDVLKILKEGLKSGSPEEVSVCAYSLGALAETDAIDLLVQAADRIAPNTTISPEKERCVNQIASTASLLARLDAKSCQANRESSPGRLAVWANMIRTKPEYRTGDWEDLILYMLNLDCVVTRMAAIRWLPKDFTKREQIPWKKLLLEENRQTWWHAIQVARQKFPAGLKGITLACIEETSDKSKRHDFQELLKEMETSNNK